MWKRQHCHPRRAWKMGEDGERSMGRGRGVMGTEPDHKAPGVLSLALLVTGSVPSGKSPFSLDLSFFPSTIKEIRSLLITLQPSCSVSL